MPWSRVSAKGVFGCQNWSTLTKMAATINDMKSARQNARKPCCRGEQTGSDHGTQRWKCHDGAEFGGVGNSECPAPKAARSMTSRLRYNDADRAIRLSFFSKHLKPATSDSDHKAEHQAADRSAETAQPAHSGRSVCENRNALQHQQAKERFIRHRKIAATHQSPLIPSFMIGPFRQSSYSQSRTATGLGLAHQVSPVQVRGNRLCARPSIPAPRWSS